MKNLKFKKSRLIPNLTDNKNKQLFRAMNIALIIGGLSLILTFLFLIVNLNKADRLSSILFARICIWIGSNDSLFARTLQTE